MYGIDSKHFCVGVTHLTGIQLSPSSASRGKKCGLFELAKGASWLQIKINQLTPSPSSLPHLPSPLTSLSSHILPLSSHVPLLSRPSPLTSLPSHTPPISHPSHLTSLPSHIPPISHPPISHPSHLTSLPFPPPKTFQGDPNLHKLDFYAEKDAFFLYARADDTTKVYVSAQAVGQNLWLAL